MRKLVVTLVGHSALFCGMDLLQIEDVLMREKSSVMQYLRRYGWEETEQLILTLTVVSYELVSNYF
jgi:spore cortex formation protein SpoVR/YcgB (stage V sporulation)